MSACLEEPAHPLRRAGVELLAHAFGTALRHTVDDAAAGASLQVTLGLRDAAARLCRCCGVGLDALLAASLPASSAAFGGAATAGAAGAAERGQQAPTVAGSEAEAEAVLLSLYPVRLRQLLLFTYEGAVAPPRRPGAGPSASSAAGAAGAGGSSEAATGPEAAPALAAAAVLARVCRGLVPQLKRYAMTSLSAAGAAFTAGASGPASSSSSTTFASSSTSPWAAVSELPAVDAELARHVVDHVMRAFEAARPILLPAPLLMVT
jgi:hypothetical protein